MFCSSCGSELAADALFCSTCGKPLKDSSRPIGILSKFDRTKLRRAAIFVCIVVIVGVSSLLYENLGFVPFTNDAMATATVEVGAGTDIATIKPGQSRTMYFWIFHNHERSIKTSVAYPDGYTYVQYQSLLVEPGRADTVPINDAPAPSLYLKNLSMGRTFFQVVEVPSGVVNNSTILDSIRAGRVEDFSADTVLSLRYKEAYAVTADATYSASENYVTKGIFAPQPGYTYELLACGETGNEGQNCGDFQTKNDDAGWYAQSGSP